MERRRHRRRPVDKKAIVTKFLICMALCVGIMVFVKATAVTAAKEKVMIDLKPASVSIRQEEALPEWKVDVIVKGDQDEILNQKTGYKVKDLVKELQSGKHYQITTKANNKTEGKYPLQIALDEEFQETLKGKLYGLIHVETKKGMVTVKNKYGDWEKDKFKKANGKYAKNELLDLGKDTYYFGKDGKYVTGELELGNKLYVFGKDGKMESMKFTGFDPTKPMMALTFDDGPGPDTDRLLDVLEKYNARATFFMVGPNAKRYQKEIKRMKELNCELGNHSTTHPQLTKLSVDGIKKEIQTTSNIVAKAAGGSGPTVMRPPFGAVNDTVKKSVGLPIIMWSIDTLDWKTRNAQSTIECVMNQAKDGDIVLMHDIHKQSVDAAVALIPKLIEKGYQLVTVSELAEARNNGMELGVKYFSFYK